MRHQQFCKPRLTHIYCAIPLLLVLLSSTALAQSNFALTAGVEHINNPLRMSDDSQSDVLSSFTAVLELARQTQRFDTQFDYSASRLEYREDQLQDQSLVNGEGSIVWKALPDVLSWSLSNSRYNQLIDVTLPDVIDNRQLIDYTSTGPSLTLPIGSANLFSLGAQHAVVNYDLSESLNQTRGIYNIGFTRALSSRISGSLRSNFTETMFDNDFTGDFKVLNYSASLAITDENFDMNFEFGEYNTKRGTVESSNPVITVGGRYSLNSRIQITAEYSESVQDLLSDVRAGNVVENTFQENDIDFENRVGNSNAANLYERKGRTLGITYSQPSSYTLGIRYANNQRNIVGLTDTERDERLSANFQYSIGPRLSLNASAQVSELDFTQGRGLQERMDFRVSLLYRLNERISFSFAASETAQTGEIAEDDFNGRNLSFAISVRR